MFSPFNMEDLAAGAVEAFKLLGDARAIAVLVSGECTAELINTDFGVNYWQLMVALPIPLYYAMTDVEREATGKAIYDVVTPFYSTLHDEALNGVTIAPRIGEASENWREEAIR
ncbi:hypothetical protein [Pseudomonas sp. SJZ131]|nr:hypothetical protein [Pseudomonas sp. SJZ131]